MIMINETLLAIIACPICKGQVIYDKAKQELICRHDRLAFPIDNGIPIMIESSTRSLSAEEL